jgi:glycosyltransferase involved in cell wall biosynthesis
MRICMVTHSLYESDCRVMRYAESLAARGDEIDVIALKKEGKPAEEMIAGVRVFRIQERSFREKRKLSFLKGVSTFFLKAAWVVTERHLRNRYDLFHIHSIPDFMVFVALVPKIMGAKVILDIHDIMPELYASKFGVSERSMGFKAMLLLECLAARFADHVIIANHIWRERLLSRSIRSGDKCTAMLNYADRSIFHPARRNKVSNDFVILYPGTLNKHQGLDVAIHAFAKIADEYPNAVFHIYGEGRMQDTLMELVERFGLQSRILFKPVLPIRAIATVMASADLAVVPKRKDSFGNEAFSTKILEFMSSGVPVVVSDTKIDQYYFNTSVVKFFRDGDADNLAQTIRLLIENQDLRDRMIKGALDFVSAFDWEVNKSAYIGIVDTLVYGPRIAHTASTPAQEIKSPLPGTLRFPNKSVRHTRAILVSELSPVDHSEDSGERSRFLT